MQSKMAEMVPHHGLKAAVEDISAQRQGELEQQQCQLAAAVESLHDQLAAFRIVG